MFPFHGTGQSIFEATQKVLDEKNIPYSKFFSLGTDGAAAMTGTGEGATGYFLRLVNPHLLNIHCIAHNLALCTSQAAGSVKFLKEFQETLTGIFYYFKRSATRVEKLKEFQAVLDQPTIRIKEVHDVRVAHNI